MTLADVSKFLRWGLCVGFSDLGGREFFPSGTPAGLSVAQRADFRQSGLLERAACCAVSLLRRGRCLTGRTGVNQPTAVQGDVSVVWRAWPCREVMSRKSTARGILFLAPVRITL